MKQTALVSFLWPKHVCVLEQYLATRPRVVLTLKGSITVELRRLVSVGGGTLIALEDLLGPGEIQTIMENAAAVNLNASHAMSEKGWVSFIETMQLDAERVKPLITDTLFPCVQREMIVVEALEKAWREYFIELLVVNEDWTAVPRCAVEWAKTHHIPSLHLSHATALAKAYTVHSTVLSDVVAVFGKRGAESLLDAGVPEERVRVTGNPAWDIYPALRERREHIKHGIFTKYGLNRALPLVVFGTTWDAKLTAISDADGYRRTLRVFLSACQTLIQNGVSANFLIKDRPANLVVGQETVARIADDLHLPGERFVYATADTEALVVSADIVISVDSNLTVEALLAGVPAINLVDKSGLRLGPSFDGESGIVDVGPAELSTAIRSLLDNASLRGSLLETMRAKADYYNMGQDGKATGRVVALMAEMALKRAGKETPFRDKGYIWEELANGGEVELNPEYLNLPRLELVEMFVHEPRLVLEIGCATGATGALIKKNYPEAFVLGIEPNQASAKIAENRIDKVISRRMEDIDFAAESIAESSIDTVIIADVLEHMVDPWSTMVRLKSYLAPGAQILASLPNVRNLWVINELAQGRWRYEKAGLLDVTHLRFFTLEEVMRFFRETGYNILKVANAPDVRCKGIQHTGGSINLETDKIVIKNVSPDELLELKTLQFLVLAMPSEEALPVNVIEQVRLADLKVLEGDLPAAQQAIGQALELTPNDPELIVVLGNILLRGGDVEAARREFVKATVLAPDYAPAHGNLAAVLLHLGSAEEAEASARRALALNPHDTDALKVLARVCLDSERYTEAVQTYSTILQENPNDVETLLVVGNCYADAGRPEDAKRFYQRVLQLNPGNTVAAENLTAISVNRDASDSVTLRADRLSEDPETLSGARPISHEPLVSVVIVTYNSARTIRACLESVFHCTHYPIELIVVDNASTDATRAVLAEYRDRITARLNAENTGFSRGCNQGIRTSAGQHVVLLNPDTVVTSGWLERLLSHASAGVGAVGPVSDYVAGLQKFHLYLPSHQPAAMALPELADLLGGVNQGKAVETKLLIGFCLLVPRKVLDEVGLLDEDLFLGNDDLDLSWRLRLRGYRLLVATDTFVHHEGQASFKSEAETKTSRLVQESTDRLYAKLVAHYGPGNVPSPMELWDIDWFKPTKSPHPPFIKGGTVPFTSIIILTHNSLDHTRKCLTSIEAHTPEPHELVIVDNGSDDGTMEYLRSYMAAHDNVRVIANRSNRGFAAGNNQGLALARGDYLLLLNNDTIVTTGWLQRMLQVFEAHPDVGIVGPMSNYVSGPQLVREASYKGPEGLEAFAVEWAQDHDGQSAEATRVVGFCLLTRKEVIARIGGLDEQFGSGNFEDDDFCIRAFQVGFRARIALDAFIHHTGSQTFKSAKIDYRQSLTRNWELFKAKWDIPADAPYEKGYRFPPQTAQGSDLSIPLPDVGADHRCEDQGCWWQETCGKPIERIDKAMGQAQPAVVEEALLSVVIVPNGHGLAPLWPSLVQHTKHPLAITILPSHGNSDGADPAHEATCPGGWQIGASDLPAVRLLNRLLESAHDDPVILLSSNLILTPGWLKRLLAAFDRDRRIAVVGPTLNQGQAAQRIKADYKGTGKALRQFALRRAHRYGEELAEVDGLTPFCIVFKGSVCRAVGPLREDLDLSASLHDYFARLRQTGCTVAVALDAYVHYELPADLLSRGRLPN